ncbi:MAG: Antirepressor regulating drug resistance protein [Phycisphaerales bacterium]|nr:Antirepressor regulating drug resistance protein [Phycisphaerales bacterium]
MTPLAMSIDATAAMSALAWASVQGGAALAVVWALCRMWRRMPGRVRCWLWRLAYVKVLAALIWTTPLQLALLPPPVPAQVSSNVTRKEATAAPMPSSSSSPEITNKPSVSRSAAAPVGARINAAAIASPKANMLPAVAVTLWCIGATLAVLRLVRHSRAGARLRRRCVPLAESGLALALEDLTGRFGLRRPPRLLTGTDVPGPLLLGIVRPTIVLPAELLDAGIQTIQAVLAHELAHVRRRDLAWTWLGATVGVLFFFHPLVWLARREERGAEEMACDELAIAVSRVQACDYARALVAVAARAFAPAPALAAGVVDSRKVLEQRILAMTHLANWSKRRWALAVAAAVLLSLLAIPPWRVVAQDKPAANPAAPAKPNPTTDASAAEDLPALLKQLEIEELARKDAQLMRLLAERSRAQRELNDLVKVQGYGETHPRVLEMKKAQEDVDLEVIARARKVKEALGRRAAEHRVVGWIAAATLRVRPAGDGLVDQVSVHEGDRVKKGDVLIQLDARRAQTALARTEAKLALAEAQFARVQALAKQATVSQEEVDQKLAELKVAQADLNVAKQDLAETRIFSPIDGTVGEVSVRAGERITRDQTLATVVETGVLKLQASIPLSELAVYAVGQPIAVRVAAYPKRAFTAQISSISPIVDGGSETVRIDATLTGDTTGLLSNMSATVTSTPAAKESAKQP